jgi:hypothetical protein
MTAIGPFEVIEVSMFLLFTCEHCGARIKVDGRSQGKRGRCSQCGQVMIIPHMEAHAPPKLAHAPETARDSDAPFRLSPPDERPHGSHVPPVLVEPQHLDQHADAEGLSGFELIAGDANPEEATLASPEVRRGLRELDEFQKDPHPYKLVDSLEKSFLTRWARDSGPAGWVVVKWRQGVGLILKMLRWIDDWAYLISVPFIILVIFAIAVQNPRWVHLGAVVVVLANYGRFWTDLLAIFVRPFKEGPIHGLAFLFPPYGIYYLWTRRDKFKPTLRRLVTSCIPIVLVVLAYAYLPFVNPAARDAKGLPEKILSGERELIHEIRDDLKEVEEKIPSLEKRERSEEKATP